jgi:hypothetical protein
MRFLHSKQHAGEAAVRDGPKPAGTTGFGVITGVV